MRAWRLLLIGGVLAAIATLVMSAGLFRTHNASANPLGGLVSISAGESHTCAITEAGSVKCWGENVYGQLGDGQNDGDETPSELVPGDTGELSGTAISLTSGAAHTCVLISGGTVECWGRDTWGQLGYPGQRELASPTTVRGLASPAIAIAAGYSHTCAIVAGGTVQCWGENVYGQLGNGKVSCGLYITCDGTPSEVHDISNATAIAAGTGHTCAVLATGHVACWGSDRSGQLGDGSGSDSASPVDVLDISDAVTLAAGAEHTCAVTRSGGVKCWGIGYGNTPVDVPGLESGVAAITASQSHTCALMTSGGLKCWGENGFGQLGDGRRCGDICSTPVDVLGLQEGVAQVAAGSEHTCAIKTDGTAMCWGMNYEGQLGNGMGAFNQTVNAPVDVVEAQIKPTPTATPCAPEGCPTPTPRPAPPQTGLDFSISIDTDGNGIADCGTAAGQDPQCFLSEGSAFEVLVTLHALPPGVADYEGFDLEFSFAGIASDHKSDVVWPDCGFPATYYQDNLVAFGCGVPVGNITSSYIGPIGKSRFTCSGPGSVTLEHGRGHTDLVRRVGDVRNEAPSGGEQLVLNCGTARAGDVDCTAAVNSVDAQLMLQDDSKLIDFLGCPQFADVNLDRSSNALDSLLTLQYSAGLLKGLPILPQGP